MATPESKSGTIATSIGCGLLVIMSFAIGLAVGNGLPNDQALEAARERTACLYVCTNSDGAPDWGDVGVEQVLPATALLPTRCVCENFKSKISWVVPVKRW